MEVTVKVSDNTYELCKALGMFVSDVRTALADGWQPMSDVPAIVLSGIKRCAPVIASIPSIPAEMQQREEFINALALGLAELIKDITKK
jgi:hypothetical protein